MKMRNQRRQRVCSSLHCYSGAPVDSPRRRSDSSMSRQTSEFSEEPPIKAAEVVAVLLKYAWNLKSALDSLMDRSSCLVQAIYQQPVRWRQNQEYPRLLLVGSIASFLCFLAAAICFVSVFWTLPADVVSGQDHVAKVRAPEMSSPDPAYVGSEPSDTFAALLLYQTKFSINTEGKSTSEDHSTMATATAQTSVADQKAVGSAAAGVGGKKRSKSDRRLPANIRVIIVFALSAAGGCALNIVHPVRSALLCGM